MKKLSLQMRDEIYRKLSHLAEQDQQPVDQFASYKLEELVRTLEDFAELEHRAQRGSVRKFKTAMAKVPKGPPSPGDELPN